MTVTATRPARTSRLFGPSAVARFLTGQEVTVRLNGWRDPLWIVDAGPSTVTLRAPNGAETTAKIADLHPA